ncbi:hypothetical protein M514_10390, partial [Trichuris suis]
VLAFLCLPLWLLYICGRISEKTHSSLFYGLFLGKHHFHLESYGIRHRGL